MQHNFYLNNIRSSWSQPVFRSPDEYNGEDTVIVSCTQLGDMALQKKLVKAWRDFLPQASGIKGLALASKAPEALFEAACRVPNLERLWIKWSGIKDASAIGEAKNLRLLDFGSSPSAQNIEVIATLQYLEILRLQNIRAVYDLGWLAEMEGLVELGVNGSMWTTQKIDSLEPLVALSQLRHLQISNTKANCPESLRSLVALEHLELMTIAYMWPKEHIRFLVEHHARLHVQGWPWD